MIQLDFVCWIFETAILIISEKVGLELNHELGYKYQCVYLNMTRNFVVGLLKSGKKLAALYFGICLPRKKFLPQLYRRGFSALVILHLQN